jgi:hypothetical protein
MYCSLVCYGWFDVCNDAGSGRESNGTGRLEKLKKGFTRATMKMMML